MNKILLLLILFFSMIAYANDTSVDIYEKIKQENKLNNAKSISWDPYMKALEGKIKQKWEPPKQSTSKLVVVLFLIAKDGSLADLRIHQSSNLKSVDEAALRAVKLATPFDPLPEEFDGNAVPVEFTFDYNVFINIDKKSMDYEKSMQEYRKSNAESINWNPYKKAVEDKIKKNWKPPKQDTSKQVKVAFLIYKDGSYSYLRISKTSDSRSVDKAALNAVIASAPFEPLPSEYSGIAIPMEFTFDYNVKKSLLLYDDQATKINNAQYLHQSTKPSDDIMLYFGNKFKKDK